MDVLRLLEPADGAVTAPLQEHPQAEPVAGAAPTGDRGAVYAWSQLQIVSEDRSVPRPVRLAWERLPRSWRPTTYTLTLSTAPDLSRDRLVFERLSKPTHDVWHLFIGTPYWWQVTAHRGGQAVAQSPIGHFTTNSLPPRWIRVPGVTNVRDLGGWPLPNGRRVRQGMLYRGSEMNGSLCISARGRDILERELGIRTDLDLRGEHERASPALDPARVQWVHLPISPYDCICDAAFADAYRAIFERLADPEAYPLLFHCVGGADRGGTVAFLVNALLGKQREHLIRDYELTTLSVWGERSWTSEQFLGLIEALKTFSPDPHNLQEQVENYMKGLGVTDAAIASIRRLLIEDPPAHT